MNHFALVVWLLPELYPAAHPPAAGYHGLAQRRSTSRSSSGSLSGGGTTDAGLIQAANLERGRTTLNRLS